MEDPPPCLVNKLHDRDSHLSVCQRDDVFSVNYSVPISISRERIGSELDFVSVNYSVPVSVRQKRIGAELDFVSVSYSIPVSV